ncbi:PAS domain S-box protein [uncultured Desulfosarcina sp.]|uniref:two-component system sensor histidine kinase NtrB n=1 Tax=uncultured Desulfosarcina sp. TaxID=218289 RepID=UPI0029C8A541|nr:PAS domain S-box protein [uncultured Desulfosarcina sp.]
MIEKKDRTRIWAMAIMLISAAILTIYFHLVLARATVFTHLFYIPIILGALWWGRTGMAVPLTLSVLLIGCHLLRHVHASGLDNAFRVCMFFLVSYVVVFLRNTILSTQTALAEQAADLQNRVRALSCLAAINRLRDRPTLSLEEIFKKTVQILRDVGFGIESKVRLYYQSHRFGDREDDDEGVKIESDIYSEDETLGRLEIVLPKAASQDDKYLENARDLTDTVAGRMAIIILHEKARSELERHRLRLEDLVRERTEELVVVNRRLREEIDERAKIETALRESERQYRALFDNANDAIFIAQEGRILFPNPGLSALSGFSREELLESLLFDLVHPEDLELVSGRYRKRLAGESVPSSYPFRIVTARKSTIWVEINSVVIHWHGQPATLNFLRDITARKMIEATVGQIQKLEAIGALAGGIAHQFNNKLSAITGNIDLLRFSFPDHPQVSRYCDSMINSAESMTDLTQRLLAYARGGRYQAGRHTLRQLVLDAAHLIGDTGDKKIVIETEFAEDTPDIEGDPVQLGMVLREVIVNAAEAIEEKGHIRIGTHRARIDDVAAGAFLGLQPGEYAGLSVADNGIGMSPESCEKIFDPFYTTKFLGRGMGMAAAYGIIKNHEGYIYVDSEEGIGTVVHIFLPCADSFAAGKQ